MREIDGLTAASIVSALGGAIRPVSGLITTRLGSGLRQVGVDVPFIVGGGRSG